MANTIASKEMRKVLTVAKKEWREQHKSVAFACNLFNNTTKIKEGKPLFDFCKDLGLITEKGKCDMNTRHFFKIETTFYKAIKVQKKYTEAVKGFEGASEEEMVKYAEAKDGNIYRLAPITKFSIENLMELAFAGKVLDGARVFEAPLALSRPPKQEAEKPADKPAEKPADKPADKPAEKVA